MLYSTSTNGFYLREIHGDSVPSDAFEISDEQHAALLQGQSEGKTIVADDSGLPVLQDRPAPTQDQIIANITAAVQAHMDATAKDYGYDSISSAVSYADEPSVPKFQAEGQAFRQWRSLVWEHCYTLLDDVMSGGVSDPTAEEVIAELPALIWPSTA